MCGWSSQTRGFFLRGDPRRTLLCIWRVLAAENPKPLNPVPLPKHTSTLHHTPAPQTPHSAPHPCAQLSPPPFPPPDTHPAPAGPMSLLQKWSPFCMTGRSVFLLGCSDRPRSIMQRPPVHLPIATAFCRFDRFRTPPLHFSSILSGRAQLH